VGADAAVAVQAARTAPGQVATLVLPSDSSWDEGGEVAPALPVPAVPHADPLAVRTAARLLREKKNVLVLLGGLALREGAQRWANRIAAATGARLMAEGSNARVQRGRGRLPLERVPYPAPQAIERLAWVEHLILVNAKAPIGFFAYPDTPSKHYPEKASVHVLTRSEQDAESALRALAEELGAPDAPMPDPGPRPGAPRGSRPGAASCSGTTWGAPTPA
jgi:acetolactate synthase-1/2/3 large subunit